MIQDTHGSDMLEQHLEQVLPPQTAGGACRCCAVAACGVEPDSAASLPSLLAAVCWSISKAIRGPPRQRSPLEATAAQGPHDGTRAALLDTCAVASDRDCPDGQCTARIDTMDANARCRGARNVLLEMASSAGCHRLSVAGMPVTLRVHKDRSRPTWIFGVAQLPVSMRFTSIRIYFTVVTAAAMHCTARAQVETGTVFRLLSCTLTDTY